MVPLILVIPAAIAGVAGTTKLVKAGMDQNQATVINDNATQRVEDAARALDATRKQCENALEELGKQKIYVLEQNMTAFLNSFEKLKNVDFQSSIGLDELSKMALDKIEFGEIREMTNMAITITSGIATGAAGGALAAFGAYSAAGALATASTGTAISTLSGAAATNATLAWFGGGSLAAGGMGIAGGTAVLGGVVAAGAILVMGIIIGAKAGTNLEKAKTNALESEETIAQFCAGVDQCIAIRRRTNMFYALLARLDAMFLPAIYKMEDIIATEGEDYSKFSVESKKAVASVASMAVSIKAVLDTPILKEDGSLTEESESVLREK